MPLFDAADDLVFSPARDADFEFLLALRMTAMRESLERLGRFDWERGRARLRARFVPEYTRHIEWQHQRVGFLIVRADADADGWLLDHLYIHPLYQGKGVGARVLQHVLAEADAACQEVRVSALRGSRSNDFYRLHGFMQLGEGEWDVHYRRAPKAAV